MGMGGTCGRYGDGVGWSATVNDERVVVCTLVEGVDGGWVGGEMGGMLGWRSKEHHDRCKV